jgi:hypothetical protein
MAVRARVVDLILEVGAHPKALRVMNPDGFGEMRRELRVWKFKF